VVIHRGEFELNINLIEENMFPLFLHFLCPVGVHVGDKVLVHGREGEVEGISFGLMGVRLYFKDEDEGKKWFYSQYMKGTECKMSKRDWEIIHERGQKGMFLNM
jgi:hypothetical protein